MKHEGRDVIRMNDKTDHGGQVVSTSSGTVVMGVPAALEGDMTFCPRCKGKFAIKTDKAGARHEGKHYAYHGDVAECGARLLSSVSFAGAVSAAANANAQVDSETPAVDVKYDDKFVLIDEETGTPLAQTEYAIRRASGQLEFGVTDESGVTHLVTPLLEAETIEIYT